MNTLKSALTLAALVLASSLVPCFAEEDEERTARRGLVAEARMGWASLSPETRAVLDAESPAELPGLVRPVQIELPAAEQKPRGVSDRYRF